MASADPSIEPPTEADANTMTAIRETLDDVFNGQARGPEKKTGFIVLVFPIGQPEGRCNYLTNGVARSDAVKVMREVADRLDGNIATENGR